MGSSADAQSGTNRKKLSCLEKHWGLDRELTVQEDEENDSFNGRIIEDLVEAVSREMRQTLTLAPGGEFTPESIESVQQTAQQVIERQCELLQSTTQQLHKDIVAQVISEVDKLNARLMRDFNFEQFSQEIADLMNEATEAWHAKDRPSQLRKKSRTEQQRQPSGPDR